MIHLSHLGNDVVDLMGPRCRGKAEDGRFLERVFATGERETIRASADPDRTLWTLWAAKEAAYKTASKVLGTPPTFHHVLFTVTLGPFPPFPGPRPSGEEGRSFAAKVTFRDLAIAARVEVSEEAVQALTWVGDAAARTPPALVWQCARPPELARDGVRRDTDAGWREALASEFTDREWSCVSHHASALARLGARKALARELDLEEGDLEIRCRPGAPGHRIPKVFWKGEEAGVDLTLSHQGRFLSWAFLALSQRCQGR